VNLFVFGLGYSALHFVRAYRGRFARVAGTVTAPDKAAALAAEDIDARVFAPNVVNPDIKMDFKDAAALLVSIPPAQGGDAVLACFADAIGAAPRLSWIGYLSTVGVYGDHGGRWVDEATSPNPVSRRSRERLAAEKEWLDLGARAGKAVHVFRLAGIYGPDRNALKNLTDGTAKRVIKPGQVFNRIHVDDIAAVLMASIERPRAGAIYNLADDEPAPGSDVVAYAAGLAGVPPPPEIPFAAAALGPMRPASTARASASRTASSRTSSASGSATPPIARA
jgi:nucleoside-diphosphate-sugar epimerase